MSHDHRVPLTLRMLYWRAGCWSGGNWASMRTTSGGSSSEQNKYLSTKQHRSQKEQAGRRGVGDMATLARALSPRAGREQQ